MTKNELRKHDGYIEAKRKIENYSHGFTFTVYLYEMPEAKRNAMEILLMDCCDEKLIENISFDMNLNGDVTSKTYKRI